MDADWDELRVIQHVGPLPDALPAPISTLAFDNAQELLWVGSTYGRVRSFYGHELSQYTSWMGHGPDAVRQITFHDKGVISLSARVLQMSQRTGLPIWRITDEKIVDLYCMAFTSKTGNELVIAGLQDWLLKIDVEKGVISNMVPAQDRYRLMKRAGQYICAANFAGAIHILEPNTLRVVKVWQAHLGQINDMDANSDFLVTCGLSQRQQHGLMPDPMANVFDLRTLAPLNPIPFQGGAAFVRMHPRMSTTSIVASQSGQLQVVDIMNPASANLKQAAIFDSTYLTGIELASTGEALALASSLCHIHVWGSPMRMKFAEYGNPTIFADPIQPGPVMDWSEETPLNTVGLPYYNQQLLSYWPNEVYEVGRIPPKVDPETFGAWKRSNEFGIYGPLPRGRRPNQVEYTRMESQATKSIIPPKFLSEKAREASMEAPEEGRGFSDALVDLKLDGNAKKDIPHIYRKVEIKYSRFGVDDFDFEFYNRTLYSGLETHISNAYANALLQLYRFTPVLRNLTLYHTSTSCLESQCMLCELGFLIDMLEKAAGLNCQASNFLKTFSGLPAAVQLNLLEEHSHTTAFSLMIQSFNRLMLEKFVKDFKQISPENPYFNHALETNVIATIRCAHCNHEQMRPEDPLSHNLAYPSKSTLRHQGRGPPRATFSQLLKLSVERQDQMRGWCPSCRRYQQLHTTRQIRRVPNVIMINAAIHSNEARQIWASPKWLPSEIGIIVDQGQFYCYQDQDLKLHLQRGVYNIQVYELVGVVAEVSSTQNEKPHLVSMINVAASETDPTSENQWHLFNDFLVQPTTKEEALRFDASWKLPSILAYQLKSASHLIDDTWKDNIDTSWLYSNILPEKENLHNLQPLSKAEAPTPGTIVGIDAEFVSLQSEEIEIKADGTKETLRPSRLGLARVSVLRGEGEKNEVPFMDDYILTKEPVIDYLTAFSGIRPGDLDPAISKHSLVTLKMAYKKLWLLLNLGCIFVGHGLLKDFRTINIHVPRGQVIDTVDLWYIKARQRKLNLRFLTWLLLREDIQSGDSHDSVEDARSALRLYRKYIEVQSQGKTEATLKWVYKRGVEVGFKAPGAVTYNNRLQGSSSEFSENGIGTGKGRNTPDPQASEESTMASMNMTSLTPQRSRGFGSERVGGFGSPLR